MHIQNVVCFSEKQAEYSRWEMVHGRGVAMFGAEAILA